MNAADFAKLEALVGRIIADRYRVDGVVGLGGMGAVLRCHHLGLQRDVAVKVLHPEMSRHSEVSARFDREAQSASRLDHPNCVQVFDYGSWRAEPDEPPMKFMAMQLLTGCELTELLGEPLAPKRAVALIDQVLAALEHAHGQGVVHRDLKPQNVFVTHDHAGAEWLKLVDFGIAKVLSGDGADARMTRVGFIFGTPRYMSPEQAAGGDVDERTDLYAVGVMLYEMLAGRAPFEGEDVTVLIRQQLSADPPPLPPEVPPSLAKVVFRLLAKDRKDRYESATVVRRALSRAQTQHPASDVTKDAPKEPSTTASLEQLVTAPTLLPTGQASYPPVYKAVPTTPSAFPLVAPPERSKMRTLLTLGGGSIAASCALAWFLWPRDEAPRPESSVTTSEAAIVETLRNYGLAPGRASSEELQKLDEAIGNKRYAEARELAAPLLEQYPRDAQLLWRQGKILAKTEGERLLALAHYGKALESDRDLLDDQIFWSELSALMREEPLRSAAIDLAVTKLDGRGHPFLLELVNRDADIVEHAERHRILDVLADGKLSSQVDWKLQRALDLWQAEQASDPCDVFEDALEQIDDDPDPYYLGTLDRIKPPKAAQKQEAARCEELQGELERVKKAYAERYGTYQGERVVPAAFKRKKRKRRTLRSILGL